MSALRRLVLLRHGETVGESSIRFHGNNDVAISGLGLAHARAARHALRREYFDLVVASTLQRAFTTAGIVAEGAPVRLEPGFREVHFGCFEGLTDEEIQARYPEQHAAWQAAGPAGFDYPGGDARADFVARVLAGFERLATLGATRPLVVAHKGPIRIIAEHLLGEPLPQPIPELGAPVRLVRDGVRWRFLADG